MTTPTNIDGSIFKTPVFLYLIYIATCFGGIIFGLVNGAASFSLVPIVFYSILSFLITGILFTVSYLRGSLLNNYTSFTLKTFYPILIFLSTVIKVLFPGSVLGFKSLNANVILPASDVVYLTTIVMAAWFISIELRLISLYSFVEPPSTPKKKGMHSVDAAIPAIKSHQKELSEKGGTVIDNVIKSLMARAEAAIKTTNTVLILIVLIVLIGGGASVGTVFFNDIKKARELEIERQNLVEISTQLTDLVTKVKKADTATIRQITSTVQTKLNDTRQYKDLLVSLNEKTTISWEDIAMRVTIAALTLFLVQVFFQIYKYNQQQSFYLRSKAEAVELYKMDDIDKTGLPANLLEKLDGNIKFGKDVSTPIEQIINVLTKVKEK